MFAGFARRDGQDGRQYTPVVWTEYQNVPSADLSRAVTCAHLGSFSVAMTSLQFAVLS
jgi:hypothetical protein